MITYTENSNLGKAIKLEKIKVDEKNSFEVNVQKKLKNYIRTLSSKEADESSYSIMLLNNLKNSLMLTENNIQDIDSLENMLDILENQDEITESEIETYNKNEKKVNDEIEFVNGFLKKTTDFFDQEIFITDKSISNIIKKIKNDILSNTIEAVEDTAQQISESMKKEIKKNIDCSASDFSCFIPKSKEDHLVIATTQTCYKISFDNNVATISIEKENFHIRLNTSGVQVSNSTTNNVLFVLHQDSKYTIITNNQLEITRSVQVYQISKNGDFLEVEIGGTDLKLAVKDNVVTFEDSNEVKNSNARIENIIASVTNQKNAIEDHVTNDSPLSETPDNTTVSASSVKTDENIEVSAPIIPGLMDSTPVDVDEPKVESKTETITAEETPKETSNVLETDPPKDELTDNDTLIISDSNKKVILPYKVSDLQKKYDKNKKKYSSLADVIAKEYTIPVDTFKNPVKSRFREAFHLIKKKEHGSLKDAVSLGMELMFQSDLNPAIIAACKNLDELDIYLDCLDDNELEKFSCFKINYDIPPTGKK